MSFTLIAHIARSRCVRDHISCPSPPAAADWPRPSRAGTAVRRYFQRKVLLPNVTCRRTVPIDGIRGKFSPPLNCCRPTHIRRSNDSPANGVVRYACAPTVPALRILLLGQPCQSHRSEWSAQCHLHRIVPTQRDTPAQVLSRGIIAPGKFRGREHLPSGTFHRRLSPGAGTRLPSAPRPRQISRRRRIVSATLGTLGKTVPLRAGTVGSPRWLGWSNLRVMGAESAGRIPVVCIPNTSPVPAWPAR